ncbi:MAG: hypothetical protein EBU49_03425, partial [Proteobacteria bacterium]|nr:hypothetical protein [Pseudomonadota bacterium]
AAGRGASTFEIVSTDPGNRGASYLKHSDSGNVRSACLDDIVTSDVDFIKIDAEGMDADLFETLFGGGQFHGAGHARRRVQ